MWRIVKSSVCRINFARTLTPRVFLAWGSQILISYSLACSTCPLICGSGSISYGNLSRKPDSDRVIPHQRTQAIDPKWQSPPAQRKTKEVDQRADQRFPKSAAARRIHVLTL